MVLSQLITNTGSTWRLFIDIFVERNSETKNSGTDECDT